MHINFLGLLKLAKPIKMEKNIAEQMLHQPNVAFFSGLRLVQYHTDRANIELRTDKRVTVGKNERQNGKW